MSKNEQNIMNIIDSNKYGKLEESALVDFEKHISAKLPVEYKKYQLEHNGGKPFPHDFIISKKEGEDSLHHFYGLHNGPDYLQLRSNYDAYRDRMPQEIIPIADDPCGNQICIGIKGKYAGKIYFWDHEKESKKPKEIAGSFNQFLNSLFEYNDPNETYIEKIVRTNDISKLLKLIDNGYDIETLYEYDRSLIEMAAIHANNEMIEILFKKGAKLRNALQYAEQNAQFFAKHKETVELIKKLT